MNPADELRQAAKKAHAWLPQHLTMIPRLVSGNDEIPSALAWCEDHTDWDGNPPPGDPESSACFNCEIAELNHPALAELVRDLLAARHRLAVLLVTAGGAIEGNDGVIGTATDAAAIATARAINGSVP